MSSTPERFIDRELSWLAFNARVLQEAANERVPLIERLKFLAIFSSNLDEFFRVRVGSLRSLLRLKKKSVEKLDFDPARLLAKIHREVEKQQRLFGAIFDRLVPELEGAGITLVAGRDLTDEETLFAKAYFPEIRQHISGPTVLGGTGKAPFLSNRSLYLVTELWADSDAGTVTAGRIDSGILEIPTDRLSRFVVMDEARESQRVLFLDDVIRANTAVLYPGYEVGETYSVKMTRDAELYLEDEFSGNLVEMIRQSLGKRALGPPTRFLYDNRMPYPLVNSLRSALDLDEEDLVIGGRYHNFSDFFGFPDFGRSDLRYQALAPLPHKMLVHGAPVLDVVGRHDAILHFPYQSYDPVVRFFEEAAADPKVEEIRVTLYRVARRSRIVSALISAAVAGKKVTVFVEVKARFDEARNLRWASEMEAAGVTVLYSMPGIKVHCKLALVTRREKNGKRRYAYLATGNFNEKTALQYADHALFTTDKEITRDVQMVFRRLAGAKSKSSFKRLLVGPNELRKALLGLLDREIAYAEDGVPAAVTLKMNSLEDERMISKLYKANAAGVDVRLIVRGICRLDPEVDGSDKKIRVTSIVDRFLEHARVFVFANGGSREVYLGSADLMTRNLNRRIEVVFPLLDSKLADEVVQILDFQTRDSLTARLIDRKGRNEYVPREDEPIRAQVATYDWLRERG